jgi:GT2 family glycosyltransferase
VEAVGNGAVSLGAPRVSCVVVNWNGWQDTLACLESLVAQDYPSLTILVVDNASSDGSAGKIRAAFPDIEVLQSDDNRGFAAGSNLGIRRAMESGAEFVWLLNNDTIAPPDTTRKLVAAATDPGVGIVGTVLRYMQNPAKIQAWGGGSIRRWMGFVRHYDSPVELGPDSFMTFASVLLRTKMLEQVGLLDEQYFMYFEDSDLCFRAQDAGWKLAVATDTSVLHKEGGSAATRKSVRVDRIVTASGLRFLDRHGRPRGLAKALFVLSRLGKRIAAGRQSRIRAVMRGVRDWRRSESPGFMEER